MGLIGAAIAIQVAKGNYVLDVVKSLMEGVHLGEIHDSGY